MKELTRKLSEKEWELIEALRNFRKSKHNPSIELEFYLETLFEELKQEDE